MKDNTNNTKHKLGLVLSGGGAKGFAHIGAFKLMEECRLKPDIIAGTSAGALMGVLLPMVILLMKLRISLPEGSFLNLLNYKFPKPDFSTVNASDTF